jgi:hypothetical protein
MEHDAGAVVGRRDGFRFAREAFERVSAGVQA